MNHYTHYFVVTAKTNAELHEQVEGLINQEGWNLHGGVAIAVTVNSGNGRPQIIYAQSLTKVEEIQQNAHTEHLRASGTLSVR